MMVGWTGCNGSIVHIKLENFLTYRDCTIYPGPHMNLIYGPNGSGKSSIVCAVCLGLGGRPGYLGRAKKISDYVMHGKSEGSVELCLWVNNKHHLIKREISAKDESSIWRINNQKSKACQVREFLATLGIDVGNLCQVLPQDKVADFSRMNPKELLLAVEKTINGGELYTTHEKLNSYAKKLLDMLLAETKHKEDCDQARKTCEVLHGQAVRVKEFIANKKKYEHLKIKYDLQQLERLKSQFQELVSENNRVKEKLLEKRKTYKSLRNSEAEVRNELKKLEDRCVPHCNELNKIESQTSSVDSEMKRMVSNVNKCAAEVKQLQRLRDERKKNIEGIMDQVRELQDELEKAGSLENNKLLMEELNEKASKLNDERKRFVSRRDILTSQRSELETEVQNDSRKLVYLKDHKRQLFEKVCSYDKDIGEAVKWLENNKHIFKKRILTPMLLHIDLKDNKDAKYLECLVPRRDLLAFLCEDKDDMQLFIDNVRYKLKLRISACPVNTTISLDSYVPSMSLEALRPYRVRCFVKDIFNAPDIVVHFLCQFNNVHNVPIFPDLPDSLLETLCSLNGLSLFFTTSSRYTMKKSAYSDAVTVQMLYIKSGNLLNSSGSALEIENYEKKLKNLKTKLDSVNGELSSIDDQIAGCRQMASELDKEQKAINDEVKRLKSIKQKLCRKQELLEGLQNESKLSAEIEHNEKRLVECRLKRICYLKNSLSDLFSERNRDVLRDIFISKVEKRYLMKDISSLGKELKMCGGEFDEIKLVSDKLHTEMSTLNMKIKLSVEAIEKEHGASEIGQFPKNTRKQLLDLPSDVDSICNAMKELELIIKCSTQTDDNVLSQYESSTRKLHNAEEHLNMMKNELAKTEGERSALFSEWITALKHIINVLDENFRQGLGALSGSGSIKLFENDSKDTENYGIEIWIKYEKDPQELRLDSMRQSGGEKSVATALFLMSLQHVTDAPIRIVDEINQGMDEKNERATFKVMVDTIKRLANSQYFMLSPKALPNMNYDGKITVLTVFNSVSVKENRKRLCN